MSHSDFSLFLEGKAENLDVSQERTGFWAVFLTSEIIFACPINVISSNLIAKFAEWVSQPLRVAH